VSTVTCQNLKRVDEIEKEKAIQSSK